MSTFSEILKRERENKGYSKAELARNLTYPIPLIKITKMVVNLKLMLSNKYLKN